MAPEPGYDYVIVGSGAGGGTLAARLVEAGMRVCLLEAGSDPRAIADGLPEDYDVPAFHPLASEHPAMNWKFFVRHYADDDRQKADPKAELDPATKDYGIFYPRAATLGGCTAHNAMIFIAPHESDWDEIARMTGDDSWCARHMRAYLRAVEDCRYRPIGRFFRRVRLSLLGKTFPWLSTELALPRKASRDDQLMRLIIETISFITRDIRRERMTTFAGVWAGVGWGYLEKIWRTLRFGWRSAFEKLPFSIFLPGLIEGVDPNGPRRLARGGEGACLIPLSTMGGRRVGTRERLISVQERCPGLLDIKYDTLATRVIFDANKRAKGVECRTGAQLYRAHHNPSAKEGERQEIQAAKEVILAGGAFNTPQLLMLSGVGPKDVLEKHGIQLVQELAGVGQNLQDRYEVGVVLRLDEPWASLRDAQFDKSDPLYQEWLGRRQLFKFLPEGVLNTRRGGMYTSNGAAVAFTRRSSDCLPNPDLFCMALLAKFRGYYSNYSRDDVCNPRHLNYLTFAILKAHTVNRAGSVTLRSPDPRDPPDINFRYFEEGDDPAGKDLEAVVEGLHLVREIIAQMKKQGVGLTEELPGEAIVTREQLADYVRKTAWGHHASCTCPIGPPRLGGVLGSDFKVHGTQGLRVVDASIFPRIPGFFIASAIYMIAEKAADVILKDACSGKNGKSGKSPSN